MIGQDPKISIIVDSRVDSSHSADQPASQSSVRGVVILGFRPESAARKAGMKKGDVIIEYDGAQELTTDRLARLTAVPKPQGNPTRMLFVRDGREHSVTLLPGSLGISAMDTTIQGPSGTAQIDPDKKSNNVAILDLAPTEEPLFVLRYRPYKVLLQVIFYSLGIFLVTVGLFVAPDTGEAKLRILVVKTIAGLAVAALIVVVIDMILLEEIRLYRTKIVKIGKWRHVREVELHDATVFGMKYLFFSVKRLFKTCPPLSLSAIKELARGVGYEETLADREEVKKLNGLLADISGRKLEEFERPLVQIRGLIERNPNAKAGP